MKKEVAGYCFLFIFKQMGESNGRRVNFSLLKASKKNQQTGESNGEKSKMNFT
jgi:hypothetical protein